MQNLHRLQNKMPTYLILRAEKDAVKTATELQNQGHTVIVEPIFFIEKLAVDIGNAKPQALIITSSNACDAIINSNLTHDIAIFAVGLKSAQKLIEKGYNNVFYAPNNCAESLKNLIIKNLKPENGDILYFCGHDITLDFKLELELEGFSVAKLVSYKVHWHQNFSAKFLQKTREKPIDFVLFYSQNSVNKFYELAKNNNLLEYFGNSRLLCLSDKIAITAKNLGFKNLGDFKNL